ncbi:hypothetical protein GTA62_20305 [Roseobacter sp. HKCCD9010]|uniref:anti-sigma factor family protein n=1 Tax=unclassified Roseobacter TaxID=196798 RepID=UPI001491DB92|nr:MULTISPECIES: anti-sigma factor [unclassified Roseobacter]MBF9052354.1 hypothetical protein [Rhodobacterales bacterium HKCCD4356]NNV14341.1 hypothetical protein [Roseobacter sp. HKCCD7357]NNV18520.1 hypothetical protein [Roseobacter sp. HKCCD8768]NNV27958.1 hypothetical protein [Roseobacter sp. HKCCD8192]NNV32236.1 hypothetical protein [Roseobacter sp. HKCCD9061]
MTVINEDQLYHYIDGELGPDEAAELEARMDGDPDLRAQFDALAQQNNLIKEAASHLAHGPANLRTAALEQQLTESLGKRSRGPSRVIVVPQWPMQLAAACALVAFGWWGHSQTEPASFGFPEYVQDAVGAHSVFASDNEYAVEFAAAALPDALEWLSTRFGVSYPQPDLSSLGIELVGARVMSSRAEPLVQYVYEGRSGERLSLVLTRHPQGEPLMDIEVVEYPDSQVGYWRHADFDYAVISEAGSIDPLLVAGLLSP